MPKKKQLVPDDGTRAFFIEGYEPLYYWFEVLDCVRRSLLR